VFCYEQFHVFIFWHSQIFAASGVALACFFALFFTSKTMIYDPNYLASISSYDCS